MILLDTIKCEINKDFIKEIDKKVIYENSILIIKPGNIESELQIKENLLFGLHEIIIKLYKDEIEKVIIEFSAKILKGKYRYLISKDTIEEVEKIINTNIYLQFKPGFLITSKAYRVDCVNDIYLTEPVMGIKAISLLRNNHKYSIQVYGKNESILFSRNAKTIKESVLFYRKEIELKRKRNNYLLSFLSKGDIQYFLKVIRIEQKIKKFKQMRNVFNVQENILSDILLSKAKPNYKFYQKIRGDIDFFTKIESVKSMKEILWISFIKDYNYDINMIETIIKAIDRKNLSRYRKEKYKPLLDKITGMRINKSGYKSILEEIEKQLSV